ncbi:MAG: protein jag [Minisyncoccales bacterium]
MSKEEKIKEIINEFFKKMGLSFKIESIEKKDSDFFVNLKSEDKEILLGRDSENLNQIQKILNAIVKKKIDKKIFLDLDVMGYKKRKIEYLEELAKTLADEVILTKREKILPPMSAKERRIIHLILSERKDVKTESFGKEPERRVIIKPL